MSNYTIPINQTIANKIGLEPALVLQQIKYWLEKCGRTLQGEEGTWIYNSYEEWHKQFSYWSLSKFRRIIKSLENKGLIVTKKVNAKKWNHTKWYSIDFTKFNKLSNTTKPPVKKICSKVTNRSVQNEQIINKQKNNYTNKNLSTKKPGIQKIEEKQKEREKTEIEKKNVTQKLVVIWETNIPSKGKKFVLTQAREIKLNTVFCKYFNSDIEQWKAFIADVKKSKFLMGEVTGFRIFLDWAIREENLLKIQEGNYHAKDEIESEGKVEAMSKLEKDSIADPRWKEMLKSIVQKFGEATYVSWFSKMELDSEQDGILKIRTPSNFIRDWIDINYSRTLRAIGEKHFEGMRKICFTTSVKTCCNG